jgi:hypothetical protein
MKVSRKQLALTLQCEPRVGLGEQAREELVKTLADLLLEALSEEINEKTNEQGRANEFKALP